jgi:hypothetical protein
VSDTGIKPDRRAIGTHWVPVLPGHYSVGHGQCFEGWREAESSPGSYCSQPDPILNGSVSIFPNWPEFVNWKNSSLVVPIFTKNFKLIDQKIGNIIPFGSKIKFETGFELKIQEAKLFLNLGQIYWGSNWFGKNSGKFPKVLIFLTF